MVIPTSLLPKVAYLPRYLLPACIHGSVSTHTHARRVPATRRTGAGVVGCEATPSRSTTVHCLRGREPPKMFMGGVPLPSGCSCLCTLLRKIRVPTAFPAPGSPLCQAPEKIRRAVCVPVPVTSGPRHWSGEAIGRRGRRHKKEARFSPHPFPGFPAC